MLAVLAYAFWGELYFWSWLSHIWRKKNKKSKAKPLWQTVQTKQEFCARTEKTSPSIISKQSKGSGGITSSISTTTINVTSVNTPTTQQSTTTTSTTPIHKKFSNYLVLWIRRSDPALQPQFYFPSIYSFRQFFTFKISLAGANKFCDSIKIFKLGG